MEANQQLQVPWIIKRVQPELHSKLEKFSSNKKTNYANLKSE
jgi:hypothetical protein